MTDNATTGAVPAADSAPATGTTTWNTPDFEIIETSLEVTAYFGAEL
ncbi:pyrroloquinoline quinone precursor peptide PqqA [Spirillospora sp. NPDC047279]